MHIGAFKNGQRYGKGAIYKIVEGERIKILEGMFNGKKCRLTGTPNPDFFENGKLKNI